MPGFFLQRLNSDVVQEPLQSDHLTLIAIDLAAGLKLLYPYLEVMTVPGTTYKSPTTDITTVGNQNRTHHFDRSD